MPHGILTFRSEQLNPDDRALVMAAEVMFNSATGTGVLQGRLFEGIKFWLSARVPQRTRFISDIKVCLYEYSTLCALTMHLILIFLGKRR